MELFKTLEACDEALLELSQDQGKINTKRNLIVKSLYELGQSNREISERLAGFGFELGRSQVGRITQGMRKQGLVEERAPSAHPKAVAARRQREAANAHDAQVQPDPLLQTLDQQIKEQRAKAEPSILEALRQPVKAPSEKKSIRIEVTTSEPRQRVEEEPAVDYSYTQISEEAFDKDLDLIAGEYGKLLAKLKDAATYLNGFLRGLQHSHGTRILEDVRHKASYSGGLASTDLDLVLESVNELRDVYEMASSSNPPKSFNQS